MSPFVVFLSLLLLATFTTQNVRCDATTEATELALEFSGQLRAPVQLVRKFEKELQAIRNAYPQVSDIVYRPPWVSGQLIAIVTDEQLDRIRNKYGGVTSRTLFDEYVVLTFETQYNPKALAQELTTKKLVNYAEPNNIMGDGDNIEYKSPIYKFVKGWGDCPAGCTMNHYWEFIVIRSNAILIREHGTPLDATDAS